ncbi:MAG TPA: amidase, partial [Casimicrobiaceae bacterium]|nr:amidase [Casimicrobiaceae bacterium]
MSLIDEILTIDAAASLLRARKISASELVRDCLARIERYDDAIHAFITLAPEQALAAAAQADREIGQGGYRGALHGIPYAAKDVIDVQGLPTTAGSRAFGSSRAAASAGVVERLASAGAIVLGKTNTHELTYGGVDSSAPYPPARNPWNTARDPGGSSSGSAAAVAAGFCLAALGTDTGGSVRLPAGLCGIAGLKPTFGRVSRRGVMVNSYSLDHCGPLAWSVADCALLLQAIAGHDPRDPASIDVPVDDFPTAIGQDIRGLRIGLVRHFYEQDLPASEHARAAMHAAITRLHDLGAEIEEVRLRPLQEYATHKATLQLPEIFAEYGDNVRQHPELFGAKFRDRIDRGDRVSAV